MTVVDTISHEYGWSDQTVLDLTVAKARSYLQAINTRRKGEFRRAISLTEWSTRLLAQVSLAAAGGDKKAQESIAKEQFPWHEDEAEEKALTEDDDLSFLETGDTSAAEKNSGKVLPFTPQ